MTTVAARDLPLLTELTVQTLVLARQQWAEPHKTPTDLNVMEQTF